VANEIVLLPVFASPQDDVAKDVLGACFPGRRIVPIDCRALVGGLGALHCLTQQVPAAGRCAGSGGRCVEPVPEPARRRRRARVRGGAARCPRDAVSEPTPFSPYRLHLTLMALRSALLWRS